MFFHQLDLLCPIIPIHVLSSYTIYARIITCKCGIAILASLHMVDNANVCNDNNSPLYNHVAKVGCFVNEFVLKSKELYNLEQTITIDEIIVPYRSIYCNVRPFMN